MYSIRSVRGCGLSSPMGCLCLPKDGSLLWVSKPISRAYGWSMTVVGTRHAPSPYYAPGPFRPYEEDMSPDTTFRPSRVFSRQALHRNQVLSGSLGARALSARGARTDALTTARCN